MINQPSIVVITGLMASGKSTVAEALATRLPLAAHIRGDNFRRMITSGRAPMTPPMSATARSQLELRHQLAASTASAYFEAGITAVVQDLYLGTDLARFLSLLVHRPLHLIVLAPRPEMIEERERLRAKTGYDGWSIAEFDQELHLRTPKLGFWLDNSDLTVDQTVDAVIASSDLALIQ